MGVPAMPFDMVDEVSPEQVAASLARLETELKYLSSAIERLAAHLERVESRQTITERLAEKASAAWWTITKCAGATAAFVGSIAWLLEHSPKIAAIAGTMK